MQRLWIEPYFPTWMGGRPPVSKGDDRPPHPAFATMEPEVRHRTLHEVLETLRASGVTDGDRRPRDPRNPGPPPPGGYYLQGGHSSHRSTGGNNAAKGAKDGVSSARRNSYGTKSGPYNGAPYNKGAGRGASYGKSGKPHNTTLEVRPYVHSLISNTMNEKVRSMLLELNRAQEAWFWECKKNADAVESSRATGEENQKSLATANSGPSAEMTAAKMPDPEKRMVLGFREISRRIKQNLLVGLIVAPNLDSGSLDQAVEEILEQVGRSSGLWRACGPGSGRGTLDGQVV